MNWLFPSIVATLMGTIILASTYYFLYRSDKKTYLAIWALAWCIYAARFFLMLLYLASGPGLLKSILLLSNQLFSLGSGVVLLWGTYAFLNRKFPRHLVYLSGIVSIYIVLTGILSPSFFLLSLPTFLFLGWIYILTGIVFIRQTQIHESSVKNVVGISFILWGIHKADYPVLRTVSWFAPWGYLIGATLEVIIAIGMLMIYFQRAQRQTKESEAQYRLLAETTQDIILLHDMEGRITYVNQTGLDFAGFKQVEAIRRPIADYIPAEHQAEIAARYARRAIGDDQGFRYETEFVNRKGERIPVDVNSTPILRDGRVSEVLIVARDITGNRQAAKEHEKLAAQLIQAQKMESVGRLAGGVAHDYNNMLSVIIGHAELALDRTGPHVPVHADLEQILKAAKRSADITRQLLAFARRQPIAPKVIDLNDTVESMLKMLRRLIGEDIHLAWFPNAALWPVKIDPAQMDQILANLCVNARDAIKDVGRITMETDRVIIDEGYCENHAGFVPGDFVMLAVSDDGCGMNKETREMIFEPFFTTKTSGRGTGLGLATVYGIVKQNNGFISVYSEPEKGTTIKTYLPAHAGKIQATRTDNIQDIPPGQNETILLVEDEVAILTLGKKMIEKLGYAVLAANTPAAAKDLAKKHTGNIDLLITDVVMPEMNGRDLADWMLAAFPDIKILFMSGYTANVIIHRGVLDDGVNFIQKPFSKKDLAVKIRDVLDKGPA
jgi:two-component system, cell cycle sensor histidine kinase and response regulator CckA